MATPPRFFDRTVCTGLVWLGTFVWGVVFAGPVTAAPAGEHARARKLMEEAQQTTNPIRLFMLALDIHKALDAALERNPDDVEVRLDLLRFHTMTPRIAGGDPDAAREQAAEIERRDEALGHFARGYLAYRDKELGKGRIELREAMRLAKTPATRALAAKWLGWLSQESQQYDTAFQLFEELRATDPTAALEIARTASFCHCQLDRGRAALREYRKKFPKDEKARKLKF